MIQVEGLITVPVPGTLVRVTTAIAAFSGGITNDPTRFTCHAALFQTWHLNTGKIYVCRSDGVRGSGAGVSCVLAIPTSNSIPAYSIALTIAPSGVNLSDLWLDADIASEGVLITVLVT